MRIVDGARLREQKEIIAWLFDLIRLGQLQCRSQKALCRLAVLTGLRRTLRLAARGGRCIPGTVGCAVRGPASGSSRVVLPACLERAVGSVELIVSSEVLAEYASDLVIAQRTAAARGEGFGQLLEWARKLDGERAWVIEDVRHVSGSFERFLIDRGETVVRLPPRLMADARQGVRERGKSDPIDALAIARAALREGIETLPTARLAGVELEIRLLALTSRTARGHPGHG